MTRLLPLSFVCGAALSLGGCATDRPAEGFHAALPPPSPAYAPSNGGIYQNARGYAGLIEGNRARHVGDLLTIVLVENVSASRSTTGRTDRSGSASITPPSAGPLDFLDPAALNISSGSSFSGRGEAGQRSSLRGELAVTIADVRPNGTALVVGEKQTEIGQGMEWVQFSGIVRLADIDTDNRLPSSRVADARINYAGNGAIQQASRPGWLSRFFAMVSPF
ncbi:flagellar basal body L-ring protein FlgH [Aurantiacibacter luteus]|uniref:Flagellar L-ring protein n=1 Tax=Aurantiacibacter luteus TaxID=1581420 RepID=A0A0G9MKP2_9SPHN|nr:flagellar basal body L-ring protein FlgH [Aurantiacibacter luteus]KLE31255.1 flagellar L-ring protein FlgH [Aurantiacibacter luteus]